MRRSLSYANVTSTLALFVALGGTAFAATQLAPGSVTARHLANGAVHSRHIGMNAVHRQHLAGHVRLRTMAQMRSVAGKRVPWGPKTSARAGTLGTSGLSVVAVYGPLSQDNSSVQCNPGEIIIDALSQAYGSVTTQSGILGYGNTVAITMNVGGNSSSASPSGGFWAQALALCLHYTPPAA
jgi:hypothetical protein